MKKIIYCLICCIWMYALMGCQKQSNLETERNTEFLDVEKANVEKANTAEQESEEGQKSVDTLSHVDSYTTDLSSGMKVEASVDMPELSEGNTAGIYQADFKKIDGEKLAKLLMSETEITCREQEQPGENGEPGMLWFYTGADGSELISADGTYINFSTDKFHNIQTDFGTGYDNEMSDEMFDFASQEEANADIRQLLNEVGISLYAEYECVSIDHETLREKNLEIFEGQGDDEGIQAAISALKEISWSEDYDCYNFTYYAEINGWRLGSEEREMKNAFVPGTRIYVTYTKDGIQSVYISGIYQEQDKIETGTLITMQEMLDVIDKKYSSIIMQGEYIITDIALEYVADITGKGDSYQLVPAWKCEVLHKYNTPGKTTDELIEMEQQSFILVNAVDGTELYTGGGI